MNQIYENTAWGAPDYDTGRPTTEEDIADLQEQLRLITYDVAMCPDCGHSLMHHTIGLVGPGCPPFPIDPCNLRLTKRYIRTR